MAAFDKIKNEMKVLNEESIKKEQDFTKKTKALHVQVNETEREKVKI